MDLKEKSELQAKMESLGPKDLMDIQDYKDQ